MSRKKKIKIKNNHKPVVAIQAKEVVEKVEEIFMTEPNVVEPIVSGGLKYVVKAPEPLLDVEYVKSVLSEVNAINAKKKEVEAQLIKVVAQRFEDEASLIPRVEAQIEVIRSEISEMTTLPGLLRLFKDYSIFLAIKNKETGYKQPMEPKLASLVGKLADEIITHL